MVFLILAQRIEIRIYYYLRIFLNFLKFTKIKKIELEVFNFKEN
jgi:hypothetical protein